MSTISGFIGPNPTSNRAARFAAAATPPPTRMMSSGACTGSGRTKIGRPSFSKRSPLQRAQDDLDAVVEQPGAILQRLAEHGEFERDVARAEDHAQPAVAHQVDERDLLGDLDRIVERQDHRAEDEADALVTAAMPAASVNGCGR